MTPAGLQRIFDDFSQAENDTVSKFGGTGLGLALTKRFCLDDGRDDRRPLRTWRGIELHDRDPDSTRKEARRWRWLRRGEDGISQRAAGGVRPDAIMQHAPIDAAMAHPALVRTAQRSILVPLVGAILGVLIVAVSRGIAGSVPHHGERAGVAGAWHQRCACLRRLGRRRCRPHVVAGHRENRRRACRIAPRPTRSRGQRPLQLARAAARSTLPKYPPT